MNVTRRDFLQAVATSSVAIGVGETGGKLIAASPSSLLDAARRKAAHRKRRIIYNNDGDDTWAKGADTVEKFLALRHAPLLGTQVDSIFYCTTQSFNLFTHATKTAEVFLSREATFADNNLPKFLEQQTDGLRMSCEFAHRHGLESIWTLRMNDIHDAWTPQFVSQWKKDDSRRVMAALADVSSFNDRRRLWSLVDFEHPDVEPRIVAIIEEVLRNYLVDGVELDFLRAPFYFRTTYEGQPANHQQTGVLTRLVESVRKLVLTESERQGRPLLLSARVPVSKELCRYLGIDIVHWLSHGLLDILAISGGYVAFDQPVRELIELGHQHDVPVYPCLSHSGLVYRPPRGKGAAQSPAAWNGAAARFWHGGADGIYCFNLFPAPGTPEQREHALTVLKTIGSTESIARAERMFAVCDAGWSMPAHFWAKDAEDFHQALPISLDGKSSIAVPLIVAVAGKDGQPLPPTELRLDFSGLADAEVPTVLLNSQRLEPLADSELVADVRRFRYRVAEGKSRNGSNEIRIEQVSASTKLAGAELWIGPT
ncbi:MAG: twin-arginine translocation signal domain-containing protein [Planctomycetes bacterium]|nr:twin-arginine translocation signal domain-containing protein [Planctomycetota bacterium]